MKKSCIEIKYTLPTKSSITTNKKAALLKCKVAFLLVELGKTLNFSFPTHIQVHCLLHKCI